MMKRLFTLLAATAFLAACETASTTTGDVTGSVESSSTTQHRQHPVLQARLLQEQVNCDCKR